MPGSFRTLLLLSILFDLSFTPRISHADDRREELEDEVTAAQNTLDALLLKPGANLADPEIERRRSELNDKQKALSEHFLESNRRGERSDNNTTPMRETRPKPAPSVEPETVLSGEGIPTEIQYQKGKSAGKRSRRSTPTPQPTSAAKEAPSTPSSSSPVIDPASGLSEIEYPKSNKKKR
jgi:hypothetical protein